ncbi:NAD(P)H-dependent oxidoreductase subunit E [Maricaulis sp.]|uniref:NADH-quinone oxidoreductase subunit NuoE family protein n=1 Tax=Maricaulis sp. TaxID=1486257 RepID=UPI00262BB28C|nr:NAD(P)H-dependent oxidoreductase subunit E [Maricaulis sp.]
MSHHTDGIAEICAHYKDEPSALIEILHDVQARFGHVGDEAARDIAARLNITRADVQGVRSFYSDFTTAPASPARIKLCRAEACQAVGSEALAAALTARGIETEIVYCLGNCALGPAAMVQGRLIGRADADTLEDARAEALNG